MVFAGIFEIGSDGLLVLLVTLLLRKNKDVTFEERK